MTIKEIAALCGVSPATVSNVLNGRGKTTEETSKRVLEIIERTGYQPSTVAKNLRAKSTKMIGVIAEDFTIFSTPNIIEGVMKCCEENGYGIVFCSMRLYARWKDSWFHNPELYNSALDAAIREIESINTDGIVYIAGHGRRIDGIRRKTKLPVVMAYAISTEEDIPSIIVDDVQGGYLAAMELIRAGHKRIGVLGGEQDNLHTIYRMQGFQKALYENGILNNPDYACYTRWTRQGGYDGAKKLLKETDITGLFCMSDLIASGVYDYVQEKGIRVPEDLSIIGYDNREFAEYVSPGLSTIAIPLMEIGYAAGIRLIRMLQEASSQKESEQGDATHDDRSLEKGTGEATVQDMERVPPTVIQRNSIRVIDSRN